MWKRFKHWLIKTLGGYTEEEFKMGTMTRFEFVDRHPALVNCLAVEAEFDLFNSPPKEWIEDRLVRELVDKAKPCVQWEYCEGYSYRATKLVRAYLRVVADHEGVH